MFRGESIYNLFVAVEKPTAFPPKKNKSSFSGANVLLLYYLYLLKEHPSKEWMDGRSIHFF